MPRNCISTSFSLPPALVDKLEADAKAAGYSRSAYLAYILEHTRLRPMEVIIQHGNRKNQSAQIESGPA